MTHYYVPECGLFDTKRKAARCAYRLVARGIPFAFVFEGERVEDSCHLDPKTQRRVVEFERVRGLIVRRNL